MHRSFFSFKNPSLFHFALMLLTEKRHWQLILKDTITYIKHIISKCTSPFIVYPCKNTPILRFILLKKGTYLPTVLAHIECGRSIKNRVSRWHYILIFSSLVFSLGNQSLAFSAVNCHLFLYYHRLFEYQH